MSGTSDKKKNPNLNITEAGFDEPFISKFKFYLSAAKLDFGSMRGGLPQPAAPRENFNQLPIYLQHTLFFNGEDYKKVRSMECCSRFMAYDQLREKGNKFYSKGKYYEALDFYERAMSLFRWLEYFELANESTLSSQNHLNHEQSFDDISENESRVNIPLETDTKSTEEEPGAVFEELKTKYKEFFITYSDDNTRLQDGEEMTEDADIDMRKSLLIQVYLNMCAAYIQTHHYSLAEQVCNDGLALSDKVSQLYFRKAQVLALRKDCSREQLQLAHKCISIAIEKRASEKIFSTANNNILKMLNLHNAAEAYEECRIFVEQRTAEFEAS
jgi:tetratricopeptide (TPR) repeat protein